jgi:hypothetical protein
MNPEAEIARAIQSGHYMMAIWRVENGKVHFWRMTSGFPKADFQNAVALLAEDLSKERSNVPAKIIVQ